jgi:hypothetical protein
LSLIAFPTPRAVPGEARSVRPDHLRPLSAPRRAAACSISRTSPVMWRRAAPCWSRPATTTPRRSASIALRSVRSCPRCHPDAVVEEPFKPKLTDLGEKHPVTTELPGSNGDKEPAGAAGSAWSMPIPRDAEVLMKGAQGQSLLVIGQRGQGPGGHDLIGPRLAVGTRAMRAADPIPICCVASRTG